MVSFKLTTLAVAAIFSLGAYAQRNRAPSRPFRSSSFSANRPADRGRTGFQNTANRPGPPPASNGPMSKLVTVGINAAIDRFNRRPAGRFTGGNNGSGRSSFGAMGRRPGFPNRQFNGNHGGTRIAADNQGFGSGRSPGFDGLGAKHATNSHTVNNEELGSSDSEDLGHEDLSGTDPTDENPDLGPEDSMSEDSEGTENF